MKRNYQQKKTQLKYRNTLQSVISNPCQISVQKFV